MNIDKIKSHIRDRVYMGEIERNKIRTLHTSEFFTPLQTVQEILDEYPDKIFSDPKSIWCENSVGDGEFLGEILIRKVERGVSFEQALESCLGFDIMEDNVKLCRERLLCGREDLRHIVERNILVQDAEKYDYSFNGSSKSFDENHKDFLFGPA